MCWLIRAPGQPPPGAGAGDELRIPRAQTIREVGGAYGTGMPVQTASRFVHRGPHLRESYGTPFAAWDYTAGTDEFIVGTGCRDGRSASVAPPRGSWITGTLRHHGRDARRRLQGWTRPPCFKAAQAALSGLDCPAAFGSPLASDAVEAAKDLFDRGRDARRLRCGRDDFECPAWTLPYSAERIF